jgi:hypothetical protein
MKAGQLEKIVEHWCENPINERDMYGSAIQEGFTF